MYMYVYSDFYRLYRLLWGFVIKVKLGKKISSVFVIVKVLICLDLCVLVDILFRLKRFVDLSRVFFLINVICLENYKRCSFMNYV